MAMSALFVGIVSMLLTRWLANPNSAIRILDHPNDRSLHSAPVSRTGGIAICGSLFVGLMMLWLGFDIALLPRQVVYGVVIIAILAIFEDRLGLSPLIRLCVQLGAALLLVSDGFLMHGELVPGVNLPSELAVSVLIAVTMTLWLINLYNFMDGMDGFAGGMAVIGFGALAGLGMLKGDMHFATAALIICTAVAGFLWFNFPPAKIFMGDTGSTTLGFLVAAFAIWASRAKIADLWLTLLIFSPFIMDASVTLLRRLVQGKPVWQAHRSHYYQRLVQIGWGHRRTVVVEYVVMLFCAISALFIYDKSPLIQWFVLIIVACGYVSAAIFVHLLEYKYNGSST